MAGTLRRRMLSVIAACLLVAALLHQFGQPGWRVVQAQIVEGSSPGSHVIVPQCYRSAANARRAIQVSRVKADIAIVEQIATTTIEISVQNNASSRETAELLVPVPDGAVIRSFAFAGAAKTPTARVLEKGEAKATFDAIVRKLKDPALMEFAGFNLIRTSVFPVAPHGTQTLRVTYEHLLTADGDRIDYELPRSASVIYDTPWDIQVDIKSKRPITAVYSPSHQVVTTARSKKSIALRLADEARLEPGAFQLSFLKEHGAVTATMFAYPDAAGDGGYFLMLAGLTPGDHDESAADIKRELTLVLDRSGSMRGKKLAQAKEAALQVLAGLDDGESFNVIAYNDGVEAMSRAPVMKSGETTATAESFIQSLRANGGTNLHGALVEALRPAPRQEVLPIVLFLTDGLPTVGETSEKAIRDVALKGNDYDRRIFTFGVGVDVNTPLLDGIAVATRGFATFVLPDEDVEVKVSRVFKGLDGPVLKSPELLVVDSNQLPAAGRVSDLLPNRLPDMFAGDQMVLLGRYIGNQPLHFVLEGNHRGTPKRFQFDFKVTNGGPRNAFVGRLWANRKIADLTGQIRDLGLAQAGKLAATDPRLKELTDEVVRLSTEFGILTEYTSFLAEEGTDLAALETVQQQAQANYFNRAVNTRSGAAGVNQGLNIALQRGITCSNSRNCYLDAGLNRVAITTVQQLPDTAYYRRNGRWVDRAYLENVDQTAPARVVEFGSAEFLELAWSLVKQGRQGSVSLDGDMLINVDGKAVLIKAAGPAEEQTADKKVTSR